MRIIVVGCGRLGASLARSLDRAAHEVTVIDSNEEAFKTLGPTFSGLTIRGIGFDRDVLKKAGIDRSDGLAAFTSSDEANAVIARSAREIFRVPTVVARLYDPAKADIYRRLGIQTISTISWGVKRALEIFSYSKFDIASSMGSDDGVELIHVVAPALLVGHQVDELNQAVGIQVAALERKNRTMVPTPGMTIEEGDQFYIATSLVAMDRLRDMLGNGRAN